MRHTIFDQICPKMTKNDHICAFFLRALGDFTYLSNKKNVGCQM